jgi:hypothetical protein
MTVTEQKLVLETLRHARVACRIGSLAEEMLSASIIIVSCEDTSDVSNTLAVSPGELLERILKMHTKNS